MEFKLDASQPFQQGAIASIVDLLDGRPLDASTLMTQVKSRADQTATANQLNVDFEPEVAAVGYRRVLGRENVMRNLQAVRDRLGKDNARSSRQQFREQEAEVLDLLEKSLKGEVQTTPVVSVSWQVVASGSNSAS